MACVLLSDTFGGRHVEGRHGALGGVYILVHIVCDVFMAAMGIIR